MMWSIQNVILESLTARIQGIIIAMIQVERRPELSCVWCNEEAGAKIPECGVEVEAAERNEVAEFRRRDRS